MGKGVTTVNSELLVQKPSISCFASFEAMRAFRFAADLTVLGTNVARAECKNGTESNDDTDFSRQRTKIVKRSRKEWCEMLILPGATSFFQIPYCHLQFYVPHLHSLLELNRCFLFSLEFQKPLMHSDVRLARGDNLTLQGKTVANRFRRHFTSWDVVVGKISSLTRCIDNNCYILEVSTNLSGKDRFAVSDRLFTANDIRGVSNGKEYQKLDFLCDFCLHLLPSLLNFQNSTNVQGKFQIDRGCSYYHDLGGMQRI